MGYHYLILLQEKISAPFWKVASFFLPNTNQSRFEAVALKNFYDNLFKDKSTQDCFEVGLEIENIANKYGINLPAGNVSFIDDEELLNKSDFKDLLVLEMELLDEFSKTRDFQELKIPMLAIDTKVKSIDKCIIVYDAYEDSVNMLKSLVSVFRSIINEKESLLLLHLYDDEEDIRGRENEAINYARHELKNLGVLLMHSETFSTIMGTQFGVENTLLATGKTNYLRNKELYNQLALDYPGTSFFIGGC